MEKIIKLHEPGDIFHARDGDWKLIKRKDHLAMWQKIETGKYQILLRESDKTDYEPYFLMEKRTDDRIKADYLFDEICKLLK